MHSELSGFIFESLAKSENIGSQNWKNQKKDLVQIVEELLGDAGAPTSFLLGSLSNT